MARGQNHDNTRNEHEGELKGAFASVLILGGILVVSWLTVFIIYIVRNGG